MTPLSKPRSRENLSNDIRVSMFLVYKAVTRGNRFTLALTILVTTLAFINIVFISSLMNGAINKSYQQAQENYVSNIVISPASNENYITQAQQMKRSISTLPGVISCSSRYSTPSVIRYDPDKDNNNVREKAWTIKSINPGEEVKVTSIQNYMVAGRYLDQEDRGQIMLGREISGGYNGNYEQTSLKGAGVDEEVTVAYENGVVRKYKVKGIFNTNFTLADLNAFVTEKEMETVLQVHNRASEILIKTNAFFPENFYIDKLRQLGLESDQITTYTDFLGAINSLTNTFTIVKAIITFIGLLVAGVTIFIVIFIATVNRKKQIGILKAIGMKERIIILSYIFQALFYALLGIAAGLMFINFILVPYFIRHPFSMPIGPVGLAMVNTDVSASVASMLAVSIVAGFIPSWMVTRQNIIKAIWG